jgi:hypothetical protein
MQPYQGWTPPPQVPAADGAASSPRIRADGTVHPAVSSASRPVISSTRAAAGVNWPTCAAGWTPQWSVSAGHAQPAPRAAGLEQADDVSLGITEQRER